MTEGIVVALITGGFAVLGQWVISRRARREDDVRRAALDERTSVRLDNIEAKLDVHNGYAEKLSDIRLDIAAIKAEVRNLSERKAS